MNFDKAFDTLLPFEGTEFTEYKNDAGGPTKYGISAAANPGVDIINLDKDGAKVIYKRKYWDAAHCDDMPERLKYIMFDTEVNEGEVEAVKILQHAAGITVDGICGPDTMRHAPLVDPNIYLNWRKKIYFQILAEHPQDQEFINGWVNRVERLRTMLNNNELN